MVYKNSTEEFRGDVDYSHIGVIPPYAPLQHKEISMPGNIVGVFGDRGGFNAALPVLKRALAEDCKVALYLVGTCKEQQAAGQLTLEGASIHIGPEQGENIYNSYKNTANSLLVVGASHSVEGVAAAKTALIRWSHSVLCLEDMYGSARDILGSAFASSIDKICVIDQIAADLTEEKFPAFKNKIVVTGGPHFDVTLEVKKTWKERRRLLRETMNVSDKEIVFLVAGGLNGTAGILQLLEQGIQKDGLGSKTRVVLRQHPRATTEDKNLVQTYLESKPSLQFVSVNPRIPLTSDDFLPGVEFVLSGYSTTNRFGILYQNPGVIYVGTPEIIADHEAEKGSKRPTEAQAGAAWYVQDDIQMAHAIRTIYLHRTTGDTNPHLQDILEKQARIAQYNDGHATDRVWNEMQQLMTA